MGNDWQDYRPRDRRQDRDARQPQDSYYSQQWDDAPRQNGRSQGTSGPPPSRMPEDRRGYGPPSGPRQSGSLPPHNGSGMLSRARSGTNSGSLGPQPRTSGPIGPQRSGPLGPQPRTSGPMEPSPRVTRNFGSSSGPLGPQSEYETRLSEPGNYGPPQRGPSRGMTPPQGYQPRSSGRLTSGGQGDPYTTRMPPGPNGSGRRTSSPNERGRHGGGLLSFARAASQGMRAIITGQHRAARPHRPEPPAFDAPPAALPEEAEGKPPRLPPYRRSRTRLVIHKRLERRARRSKRLLISSIITSVMAALIVAVTIYGAESVSAFYQDTQSKLSALANPNGFGQTTRFYDRNGVLLWEMTFQESENSEYYRTYVPYAIIPQNLINATVDTEDRTFWTNNGVDIFSIIRAGFSNVTGADSGQGGASTITQQLIKNAFFVDPKTGVAAENLQRKIQEALMAYAVTGRYSKQEILEFYLNIIFYGYFSRGIEAAAEDYFSLLPKEDPKTGQLMMGVQQLDLAQSALLAGLPQSPTLYSPCGDGASDRLSAALGRMHVVLTNMLNQGDITQAQMNQAEAEARKPNFFNCRPLGTKLAPHFVDYVADQLAAMLTDDGTIDRGMEILQHAGLNVYTTIDSRLETQVESIVKGYLFQPYTIHYNYDDCSVLYPRAGSDHKAGQCPPLSESNNIHDAAVVVQDPRTGDILAMDGSGDYNTTDAKHLLGGETNAAVTYIQPGSSFKPILYAEAFQMGWFPSLVLQDQFTCFPAYLTDLTGEGPKARATCGNWYAPINYGGGFLDDKKIGVQSAPPDPGVRIREALGNSLNIPAVQTLYFAGLDNVINMAERLGVTGNPANNGEYNTFSDANKGPSIALGSAGVRLIDMVDAYSALSNAGVRVPPRTILLVTDAQGNVIPGGDFEKVTGTQVISPQVAFLVTSILADNNARKAEFGPNNALTFPNNTPWVAAKTGTTDDFKDNLTIGYTPYLTVGVWAGNACCETMTPNTLGITGAAPIWHDVMAYATNTLYHYPDSYWPIPGGVGRYQVNGATGLAPYQGTSGDYADWFIDDEVPDIS